MYLNSPMKMKKQKMQENHKYRLLIAGSRGFSDYEFLKEQVQEHILKIHMLIYTDIDFVIISGSARGADQLGERFAKEHGYELETYPAEWDLYGKSAGYVRNKIMGDVCDSAILFWDGKSKGTKHMIDILEKQNKRYKLINILR